MNSGRIPLTRRRFLQVMAATSGALVVGLGHAQDARLPLKLLGDRMTRLGPFVRIEPDGRVIIGARDPDCGEGTHTALPRIIADELDADWSRVEVIGLGPELVSEDGRQRWRYGRQLSGESASVPAAWGDLRHAAALARWLLLQVAARRSGVAATQLRCENGQVIAPDGSRYGYGELVEAAARQAPPRMLPALKDPSDFRLIGRGAGDVDAHAMVTGQTRFGIDHGDPDMLVAVLLHCPYLDGRLDRIDTRAALNVPGVRQVLPITPEAGQQLGQTPLAPSVAVLATDTWSALKGRDALRVIWEPGDRANESTAAMEKQATDLVEGDSEPTTRVRQDGDPTKVFNRHHRQIEATYVQPYVAHVTAEPMNCTVRLEGDRAELVVPTQAPQDTLGLVQRLTGLDADQIDIRVPRTGGGLGRRLDQDFVAEAVLLAKAVNKPVKLMWTREQDLTHDVYRPGAVHHLAAALDRRHRIVGWRQRMASPSMLVGRGASADQLWTSEVQPDALPAGRVANFSSSWFALDSGVQRGHSRAGSNTVNCFAVQGFLDEIAHATRQDPLKLRLDLLGDVDTLPYRGRGGDIELDRLRRVLNIAAERIEWARRRTNGHGLGLAFHYTDGGYCAHAFEVSVKQARLMIHRVVCAIDVGRVVNPTGLEAQAMGATLEGISTALGQRISVQDGRIQQHDLKAYPLARMVQLPRQVDIYPVESQATPGGAFGIALPSAAPALANAVYRATTVRVRRLPLLPELMRLL